MFSSERIGKADVPDGIVIASPSLAYRLCGSKHTGMMQEKKGRGMGACYSITRIILVVNSKPTIHSRKDKALTMAS